MDMPAKEGAPIENALPNEGVAQCMFINRNGARIEQLSSDVGWS